MEQISTTDMLNMLIIHTDTHTSLLTVPGGD